MLRPVNACNEGYLAKVAEHEIAWQHEIGDHEALRTEIRDSVKSGLHQSRENTLQPMLVDVIMSVSAAGAGVDAFFVGYEVLGDKNPRIVIEPAAYFIARFEPVPNAPHFEPVIISAPVAETVQHRELVLN